MPIRTTRLAIAGISQRGAAGRLVGQPQPAAGRVRTLREIYDDSMAQTSFTLVILGIAASVTLLLGVVGIYGVIAYVVAQRRREVGIRMALGAAAGEVQRLFLRHGLGDHGRRARSWASLPLPRSCGCSTSLLFGVSPLDPVTYTASLVGLGGDRARRNVVACAAARRRRSGDRVAGRVSVRADERTAKTTLDNFLAMSFRVERDPLGDFRVPADAYYGVQTARARANFPISGLTAPGQPRPRDHPHQTRRGRSQSHARPARSPHRRRDHRGGGRGARRRAARSVRHRRVSGRCRDLAQHERQRGAGQSRRRNARRRDGHLQQRPPQRSRQHGTVDQRRVPDRDASGARARARRPRRRVPRAGSGVRE